MSDAAGEIRAVEGRSGQQAEAGEDIAYYLDRFHRAGLPLFDEDFKASTDVFNRAFPLLALVFLGEIFGAVNLEWSLAANLAAILGGLAILLTGLGLINLMRERPFFSRPRHVGAAELAGFVVVPALVPLIFGGQVTSALVTMAGNLALLLAIYAFLGYGLGSIILWVFARLTGQLAQSFTLLARAVPLIMVFGLLAFVNTEMWQIFAFESDMGLIMIGVLFVLMGVGFLLVRLPREVRQLEVDAGGGGKPLSTRQRRNVALVLFVSQALQVIVVTILIALFFAVFGLFSVTEDVRDAWIGSGGDELFTVPLFGDEFEVTSELLKVSAGLAAFSGLYFAIAMLTDASYREEFLDEVTGELRQTFRDRVAYLSLRGERAEPPPVA